jgi:hypothetical protein
MVVGMSVMTVMNMVVTSVIVMAWRHALNLRQVIGKIEAEASPRRLARHGRGAALD